MANRYKTELVDITDAVVPVDLPESVNEAKAVELIQAKVQATDTESNDGLRCNYQTCKYKNIPNVYSNIASACISKKATMFNFDVDLQNLCIVNILPLAVKYTHSLLCHP